MDPMTHMWTSMDLPIGDFLVTDVGHQPLRMTFIDGNETDAPLQPLPGPAPITPGQLPNHLDWSAFDGRTLLPDGDIIEFALNPNPTGQWGIRFTLSSSAEVDWWKELWLYSASSQALVPHWICHTDGANDTSASATYIPVGTAGMPMPSPILHPWVGMWLVFIKPKFLGAPKMVYSIDLSSMPLVIRRLGRFSLPWPTSLDFRWIRQ
jgi:hypothetical protein